MVKAVFLTAGVRSTPTSLGRRNKRTVDVVITDREARDSQNISLPAPRLLLKIGSLKWFSADESLAGLTTGCIHPAPQDFRSLRAADRPPVTHRFLFFFSFFLLFVDSNSAQL
jgi:hypothetical protein